VHANLADRLLTNNAKCLPNGLKLKKVIRLRFTNMNTYEQYRLQWPSKITYFTSIYIAAQTTQVEHPTDLCRFRLYLTRSAVAWVSAEEPERQQKMVSEISVSLSETLLAT
jgi:hypothetical protein